MDPSGLAGEHLVETSTSITSRGWPPAPAVLGQAPRARLVGTAAPFRRTDARAERTLEPPPLDSLSRGVWGSSSAPRSRALGGKSGMTRAEPLVC